MRLSLFGCLSAPEIPTLLNTLTIIRIDQSWNRAGRALDARIDGLQVNGSGRTTKPHSMEIRGTKRRGYQRAFMDSNDGDRPGRCCLVEISGKIARFYQPGKRRQDVSLLRLRDGTEEAIHFPRFAYFRGLYRSFGSQRNALNVAEGKNKASAGQAALPRDGSINLIDPNYAPLQFTRESEVGGTNVIATCNIGIPRRFLMF